MRYILVSACLLGLNTRYNGKNNFREEIVKLIEKGIILIPACPEQLGGLPTPRENAEIIGGDGSDVLRGTARVITKSGRDVTNEFIKGAKETLKVARLYNITLAILKAKSPSCGKGVIYDGTFTSSTKNGDGVTAAYLKMNNINVLTENELSEIQKLYSKPNKNKS